MVPLDKKGLKVASRKKLPMTLHIMRLTDK